MSVSLPQHHDGLTLSLYLPQLHAPLQWN